MRKCLVLLLLCLCSALGEAYTQESSKAVMNATGPLSGRWVFSTDLYGTRVYYHLRLQQQGDKLTGDFDGDKLEGSVAGNKVHFLGKDENGGTEEGDGTIENGKITGSVVFVFSDNLEHPFTRPFTATLAPSRVQGTPKRHEFTPTTFYRRFSHETSPVLTISPGDTVHTTTVDAGGTDEKGIRRVLGGNPQTGPFFVEGAAPGDMLAVHITKLRLNRDWAISDDAVVPRGVDMNWAVKLKDAGKPVRWHLDAARGEATLETPSAHLAKYAVPLRPMLGCVATAPGPAQAPPGTGDSGRWGGNMDFNEIVEGATVYLPVSNPGALLYLGDGHAAQGDGELNGNALETSMEVEFTVDVVADKQLPGPRVESATHIMAMGVDGSIDEAFRYATTNMATWLQEQYGLTPAEVAEVLGTSAEYHVSEVADRNAGVVLKISKSRLRGLAAAATQ